MQNMGFRRPLSKFIIIISLLIVPFQLKSQTDTINNPAQFLFPHFSLGIVKMKNSEKVTLLLNYNIVTEKMIFFQNDLQFDLINYENVDTIYIQKRKFIPSGKVFYEVMVKAPVSFFVQHRGSLQSPPKPAAYGGTSEVSSSDYITNINFGGDVFRMKNIAEFVVKVDPLYWIRNKDKMLSFMNEKQLLKILSDKKNDVRQFIRQNNLDVEKPSDIIRIVNHYNGFSE
jgi:hypothetical protein